VLILDEPTAVLTPQDIRALFATIRRLQESGMGVLLVSHKLKEVAEISDRVVVLRRGRLVGERRTADVTPTELANLMMGVAEVSDADTAAAVGLGVAADTQERTRTGEQVLGIRDLVVVRDGRRMLDGLTLDVAAGEIVGLAGISGNGQTELVDALCGRRSVTDGAIEVAGRDITTLPVADRLAAGLGRLTEDRRGSVVAHLTVEQNLVLEDLGAFTRRGLLDRGAVRRHAEAMIDRFEIKATPTTPVGTLSGGNIQKVLLARTLHRAPRALVAAQPTRGLDVGAYRYVHQQLTELRASGAGVLLISEDLDELRALSDRIVVLLGGRLVGEVAAADATNDRLGLLMTGQDVA
jgi:simple sugar transport system ATP-binding protein